MTILKKKPMVGPSMFDAFRLCLKTAVDSTTLNIVNKEEMTHFQKCEQTVVIWVELWKCQGNS